MEREWEDDPPGKHKRSKPKNYKSCCEPGLALKNPPKKPRKKTHLNKTTKNGFFRVFLGFFKFFIFDENNTNFSLSN
jgi:hypothetical protein